MYIKKEGICVKFVKVYNIYVYMFKLYKKKKKMVPLYYSFTFETFFFMYFKYKGCQI